MKNRTVLLLNSDYQPLDIISWKKCFTKLYADKPTLYVIVNYEDDSIMDSKGRQYPAPAIAVSKVFIATASRKSPYSKLNVFARDDFTCQYCGQRFITSELTIDHVIPRSTYKEKAKATSFENVTTACKPCNSYKGDTQLGRARYPTRPKEKWLQKLAGTSIVLHKKPVTPNRATIFKKKMQHTRIPDEWRIYL